MHSAEPPKAFMKLSINEITNLREAKWDSEWETLVADLKSKRNGSYPPDWIVFFSFR